MTLLPVSIIALGIVLAGTALAADPAKGAAAREAACIAGINERTAALVAEDWQNLARISDNYLKTCKGVFDAEDFSGAYENMAGANIGLGNPKKALSAADSCIATYYANIGCHVQRAVALIALQRLPDARVALDRSEKLIAHRIEATTRDLRTARHTPEKELLEARLNNFEAQQSHAAALRAQHFPK